MAPASLPEGRRHLIGVSWVALPYLPIHRYVVIRATKGAVQGFQPNPNMHEYTWNPNEWWINRA
jgi:hypothetical protein